MRIRVIAGRACGIAAAIVAASPSARANAGFGLNDGLADWTANAYAGEAAKAYDAGTAWTNPAGMVRLAPRFEADGSVDFIDPDVDFRGAQVFDDGAAITAPQDRHGIDPAVSVAGASVLRLAPDLAVGVAATAPFASRLSFVPQDYVGQYQSINAIPTDVQALFSLAWRVGPHLSVGGGPIVSYFKDRQTHALALSQATLDGVPIGALADPTGASPVAEFRGDDYALGYDLGGLWQFDDRWRIGVNYHSAVYHRLDGYQSVYVPPAIANGPLASVVVPTLLAQDYDAKVKITLPGWVDTSIYEQVTPRLALMGNATWTEWSRFQNERVDPLQPGVPFTTNIQLNFRDTFTIGLGANWTPAAMPRVMLQAGIGYDESPVDDRNRQAVIPDGNRVIIGLGATWSLTGTTALNIAYSHYFFPGRNTIDNGVGNQVVATALGDVLTPSGRLVGRFDLQNNSLVVGVKSMF